MEPVGGRRPARFDGGLGADLPVGVELECEAQQLEPAVVEQEVAVEHCNSRANTAARGPWPPGFAVTPGVVQQPEGEDDLRVGSGLGGEVETGGRDRGGQASAARGAATISARRGAAPRREHGRSASPDDRRSVVYREVRDIFFFLFS